MKKVELGSCQPRSVVLMMMMMTAAAVGGDAATKWESDCNCTHVTEYQQPKIHSAAD